LIAWPGSNQEKSVPIFDDLFIGRDCAGIDDEHRFLIKDRSVSRTHLELHLDAEHDQAWVVDRSTNGTRLNGSRMERSVPARILSGDRVQVGPVELHFFSRKFSAQIEADPRQTVRSVDMSELVMAVGDIVSFSTISEYTDEPVLLESTDRIYSALRRLLSVYRGSLSNYVGDAFFATWDASTTPDAAASAVNFALGAAARVREIAPSLPLRDRDGFPVRMGFAVGSGRAAVSMMAGAIVTVLGDATNVTFRLSGIASRAGWPDVVVTEAVHTLTADLFSFTGPQEVAIKGRTGRVQVYGVASS
jgi:class 3 adenylate cyclase